MRRRTAGAFGLLVALGSWPAAAAGQEDRPRTDRPTADGTQGRTCRQVLPSDFRRIVNARSQEIVFFRDPVRFLCTGDVRLEADSAVVNRSASTVELIGRVLYQDTTRELNADWANYLGRMDQLLARGSVVLRDLAGGAIIRGDQLNYMRETDARPVSRMIVTGDRPYAVLPPPTADEGDPPVADTAREPTEIWADRMEILGEDLFEAEGSVDLRRSDMVGGGRTAIFDQGADRMTLTGAAFVESEAYRLEGERIVAFLERDELREVHAEEAARLTSEELAVRAERVRIGFADGELERLEAWNPDPASATRRARADSEDFRLRADSIDAQADSLGIRELRAVGRAYGERDLPLETSAQRNARPGPGAIDRDWIQGDTIYGFFERIPADIGAGENAAGDTAAPEVAAGETAREVGPEDREDNGTVVLERIIVIGASAPALSLYRMAPEAGADRPSINFMKASRIVLFMARGELERVEAEGPIEGVHLEPAGPRQREGGEEGRQ